MGSWDEDSVGEAPGNAEQGQAGLVVPSLVKQGL